METKNGSSPTGKAAEPKDVLTTGDTVLTVKEAARLLRVNPKTVYDGVNRGQIPHQRVGRKIRLCRTSLLAWLSQGQGRVSRSKGRKS